MRIRASTHRGTAGYTVSGSDTHGRKVKIFTESLASAEHIKAKLAREEEIVSADFTVGPTIAEEQDERDDDDGQSWHPGHPDNYGDSR